MTYLYMSNICRAVMPGVGRAYFGGMDWNWSLLIAIRAPYDSSMGSQSEKESNDIREEQHDGSEPTIWPDSIHVKVIGKSRDLAEIAPSTISIGLFRHIAYSTASIANELVLQLSAITPRASQRSYPTYTAIDFVEQGGAKSGNDGEEQHG